MFSSIARSCCHVTLGLIVLAADAQAQVSRNSALDAEWSVVQALQAGQSARVKTTKGRTVSGLIVATTETAIIVVSKKGEVSLARLDVKEVKVKSGQLRKMLINGGIGAASGVAAAAILDGALTDGNGMSGSAAAFLGMLGGGVGLMVTALRPAYKTIYKVR